MKKRVEKFIEAKGDTLPVEDLARISLITRRDIRNAPAIDDTEATTETI